MTMEHAWLRTKRGDEGSMEIWVRGWRLEHRFVPALPLLLALGFPFASAALPFRIAGALALLAVAFVCQRLTRTGILITANAITIVNLRSTVWVPWGDFIGFVGERSSHDGRCILVRKSGGAVPLSGSLDGEELNPYGAEGDLSMIDELNFAVAKFRRELAAASPSSIAPVSPGARRLSAAG
jgi:hypothetical protein